MEWLCFGNGESQWTRRCGLGDWRLGFLSRPTRLSLRNTFRRKARVVLTLLTLILVGLMGTMSLNVLERTREIGVMRAIGASNGAVRGIFLTEGVTIGLLSALIAIVFSFPLGQALSALVGEAIFQLPLSYAISFNGIIMWLIIVVILSLLASFLPAYNASRLTVREILAYE